MEYVGKKSTALNALCFNYWSVKPCMKKKEVFNEMQFS